MGGDDHHHGGHSAYGSGVMSPNGMFIVLHTLRFLPVYSVVTKALGLRPGDRVLDAGAGFGLLARRIAQSGATVVCLEPDAASLAEAKKRLGTGNFEFVESGAEQIPLPDGAVDAAVASFTAHHWSDRQAGFAEIARVLRPGGRFVLAEFRPGGPLVRRWRRWTRSKHAAAPNFAGWRDELQAAGLRDVSPVETPLASVAGLFLTARR